MGPIYSLDDVIDIIRRRAPVMLFVICMGCIISLWVALNQVHLYSSHEVIQIAQPKIADGLAPSTVEGSSARRLQLIEQQLMARDNMVATIEKFGLYADRPGLRTSQKVIMLREAIGIKGVAAAREGYSDDGTISVLTISAKMESPEQAQLVAHEFATQTIELSVSSRIAQARETLDFFSLQEEKLTARIAALEARITAFRNEHNISVSGSAEFHRSEIAAINSAMLDIDRQSISLQRQADQIDSSVRQATATRLLGDLQEQLDSLAAQKTMLSARREELGRAIETPPDVQRELGQFQRQLEQMQLQLVATSLRRTEAEVGFRLETQHQSERLTVLEPASLPDFPVTSSRKRLALMGGMISVFVAAVLALVLEMRNPVIRNASQMQRELGFVPVVSIPFLDTADKRPGMFKRLRNWFSRRKPNRPRLDSAQ